MAILDKLKGVGDAVREKYQSAFGGDDADGAHDVDTDSPEHAGPKPALDDATAYRALELSEGATLADVRAAYRRLAIRLHPTARKEGPQSAAAAMLDRYLEALEHLEESLVPTSGAKVSPSSPNAAATPGRKRATPRGR